MYTIQQLEEYLTRSKAEFELIKQDKAILTTKDAEQYYDITKAAPVFILDSDKGLLACIMSANRGRMDFDFMKTKFGFSKLKMADRKKTKKATGYEPGTIPLIGHDLDCILDETLLSYDVIYGGTGNELVTLKISPIDVKRLNKIIGVL